MPRPAVPPSVTQTPRTRSLWARLRRGIGLFGLPVAANAGPAPVPAHWVSYARLAGGQFQARLSDPAQAAVVRLHAWMQERLLDDGQPLPPAPVVVRVWVGASGKVDRLEFTSLGQAQADADLRALLTAEPLSESPPPDMRQPMVLALSLSFTGPDR